MAVSLEKKTARVWWVRKAWEACQWKETFSHDVKSGDWVQTSKGYAIAVTPYEGS